MKRFMKLTDLFEIKCKKCGSINIDLTPEDCHECGLTIKGECNECGQIYDYHEFKEIEK